MKRIADPYTGKEVWKITDDPAVNLTHLYHNVDAFSADGRYLAYQSHFAVRDARRAGQPEVFAYDFVAGRVRGGHPGQNPVWNACRAQLVFDHDGQVLGWDLDTDTVDVLATSEGIQVASAECRGEWALCFYDWPRPPGRIARVALDGSGAIEVIFEGRPNEFPAWPRANPTHDVCVVRLYTDIPRPPEGKGARNLLPTGPVGCFAQKVPGTFSCPVRRRRETMDATRMLIMGTDGSNPHPVSSCDEWSHHCWSGDGQWYIFGWKCKRWNAPSDEPWQVWSPLPVGFNHTGPCGRDGRLLVGDFGNIFTSVFNRRTHEVVLMNAPMSSSVPYSKHADPHPIGSPDGTKYVFDSMYDMEHGPVTRLAQSITPLDDTLIVESTGGFAESGHLVLGYPGNGPEIVRYGAKQANRFLGCERGAPPVVSTDTVYAGLPAGNVPTAFGRGVAVMSYDALHIEPGVKRGGDIHVQVVHPPQHPRHVRARRDTGAVEVTWQAPRNAREIRTYRVWRQAPGEPWIPLADLTAAELQYHDTDAPDTALLYAVTSIEHSGLASERSATAAVAGTDRGDLPDCIVLPAGDADPPVTRYGGRPMPLAESIDDDAYNQCAVIMQHGLSMQWTFELPVPARAQVRVHARTPGLAAVLIVVCNGQRYSLMADQSEYGYVPCPVDAVGRPVPVELQQGQNVLMVGGPAEQMRVDIVRVDLRPQATGLRLQASGHASGGDS